MTVQAPPDYIFQDRDAKDTGPFDEEKGLQNETPHNDFPGVDSPRRRNGGNFADGADITANDDSDSPDEDEDEEALFSSLTFPPIQQPSPNILSRILAYIFLSPNVDEDIASYEIPGLTERWYIRTDGPTVVETRPNPVILDIGLAFSMACALLANACLIMRFLEKRVKTMTILCTVFLSIHDIINIIAVVIFGVEHRFNDGFTYGDSFWMTVCSTIASSVTNVTLIIDLIQTPDFDRSGSGLTRRQRSLVIIIIVLFCYIALGALVNSFLLKLSFINGLYFTVVSIETIGFGDISPDDAPSRAFICCYTTLGIVNLAVVVGVFRETLLEGLDIGYRKRVKAIQDRRRAARRRRRAETRWRHAIIWRLRALNAPIWVRKKKKSEPKTFWENLYYRFWRRVTTTASGGRHHRGMKLNLGALPHHQLEAAALEAGVPLDTLLPADFYESYGREPSRPSDVDTRSFPSWFVVHPVHHRDEYVPEPLTHNRLGAMAVMLTKFGLAIFDSGGQRDQWRGSSGSGDVVNDSGTKLVSRSSTGSLSAIVSDDLGGNYRTLIAESEKKAFYARSSLAWTLFILFWTVGAAIFMHTEGWTYGSSIYFCFIAFSTLGYGDMSPQTPAGRSIFVVWALLGVGTVTILVSSQYRPFVSEAYSSRYKGMLGRGSFDRAVKQYRKRAKVGPSEKIQGNTSGIRFQPHERHEQANSTAGDPDISGDAVPTTTQHAHVHAQRSLEELPRHVLSKARLVQQSMQFIGDWEGRATEVKDDVDVAIWRLLDDVVGGSEGPSEGVKLDILRDQDYRRTLVMLNMERSLRELVTVAELAMAAIDARDRVTTA
ncbi:hypothetical protein BU15DRAFT_77364 [Melanogaster broomeanus]|nr:hypothetical protein BU15DRAFT_77364 [Melanogaster broomeanus]